MAKKEALLKNVEKTRVPFRLLEDVADTIYMVRKQEALGCKTSNIQMGILYCTNFLGSQATMGNIAEQMHKSQPSISQIVARMEKRGLLKRAKQKNKVRVTLTAQGLKIYDKLMDSSSLRDIFSVLSEEQIQQLCLLLEILQTKSQEELLKFRIAKIQRGLWNSGDYKRLKLTRPQ